MKSECVEARDALKISCYGSNGYGLIQKQVNGVRTTKLAHRVMWEKRWGRIPKGLQVLHDCDNPWCVNTDHLFLGTRSDNMKDMVRKGRNRKRETYRRGSKNQNAKLTEAKVRKIRSSGETCAALSREFGVSDTLIRLIRKRLVWRHVS